jgi:hypothetical protein
MFLTKKRFLLFSVFEVELYVQSEHKSTLHFKNDAENKCGILRTSYLYQSIDKHSKFCFISRVIVVVVARLR